MYGGDHAGRLRRQFAAGRRGGCGGVGDGRGAKVVSQNNSVVPANPVMQTPVPTQPAAKIVSVAMVEPAEPTTSEPATAVPQPPTCATLQGLNLRYGPGTSYAPPLRTLAASETLLPPGLQRRGSSQWAMGAGARDRHE
ncbi:MAG: hypothetical protein M5U34_40470 [Chloroflexi bacterium]|nr:hypothetical protein [Chloroflexota bacterium]